MRSSHNELVVRLARIAFLAILAAFPLAPRSAWAGCDDHARSDVHSSWRTAQLDALLRGDPAALAPTEDPAPAVPTCSGPSCSNNVPAPLSSVVPPDVGPDRGDSLPAAAPALPSSASRMFRVLDEPFTPTFPTSRVFHPPRPIV